MQHCSRPKGWVARYIHILFVFVSFISSALLAVLAVISSRPRYVTPHGFGSIGSTLKIPALPKTAHRRFYFMAKRVIDIIVSLLVLVTVSPLMLVIILVIKLTSLGPAVFAQERVGVRRHRVNGVVQLEYCLFHFYKFRTMYNNANPEYHRQFFQAYIANDAQAMAALQKGQPKGRDRYKIVGDPRITPIGRLLRQTSLDELPQLVNVLKGDMSLVGPRPAIPYEVDMYEEWHTRRLTTQPGLTGLWQIKGRDCVCFDEMVRLDTEYIEKQSFLLDLSILTQTPFAILRGKGGT